MPKKRYSKRKIKETKRIKPRNMKKTKRIKKRRTRKGGDGDEIPEPKYPTKETVLSNIGEWNIINCIKYKKGSVMIIDNSEDSKKIALCDLFIPHKSIEKNIVYQFILFRTGDKTDILLVPAFKSPEIGTKHQCLLNRIPAGSLLLGSGELLRRENTVFYSCMSSLFFRYMFKYFYPEIKRSEKEKYNQYQLNFEANIMIKLLINILPKELTIVYVKSLKEDGNSKLPDNTIVKTGPFEKLELNPSDLCKLSATKRPDCLRYVTNEDCELLENHPKGGYCEAGLDFCSNMDQEIPIYDGIPEEVHIYNEVFDPDKSVRFLEKHQKKPSGNKFMNMSHAKRIAKTMGMNDEEITRELKVSRKVWP